MVSEQELERIKDEVPHSRVSIRRNSTFGATNMDKIISETEILLKYQG